MTSSNRMAILITLAVIAFYTLDLIPYYHAPSVAVGKALLLLFEASALLFGLNTISINKSRHRDINTAVLVYIILLLIRLIVDFVFKGKVFFVYQNTLTIFVFYTGLAIIPFLFFSNKRVSLNPKVLALGLYVVFLCALLLSLQNIMNGNAEASTSDRFAGEGGFSILFGHLGVSLFFISLCLRYIDFNRLLKISMIIVGIFVGLLSMIFSGSRGPFIAFLLLSIVFFFINAKNNKWRIAVFLSLVLVGVFFKPILGFINDFLESYDIVSFNRVYQTFMSQGDGSSGRDDYYLYAFNEFLENPIFGKAYLMDNGAYVHNIFLEQFRALGLIGGFLFLFFTLYAILRGYKTFKTQKDVLIIYLLFVQYVVYGCFSSSIIAIPQYWIGLFVVLNYINQNGVSVSRYSNVRMQRPS